MSTFINFQSAKRYIFFACILALFSNEAFSRGGDDHGHAGDVFIYVEEGHIETGLVDEDNTEEHVRVFEAEFGESGLPEYTDEPGWEAFAGTFDPALRVGWNATDGLHRWNGSGLDHDIEETIMVNFGTLTFEIGQEPVDGFDLAVAPDGSFHRHVGFLIDGPAGPQPGIYIVELELFAATTRRSFDAPEHSEPFWIVFNYSGSEEEHEEAIEWVAENLAGDDHGHEGCHGDFNDDDDVNVVDLLVLISEWGACSGCDADLDANGIVDVTDLLELMADWGECPENDPGDEG
tara:strand:+ start:1154 stop:2026 length:873 start_codon:yes stop_codon:yes gene_type:complete